VYNDLYMLVDLLLKTSNYFSRKVYYCVVYIYIVVKDLISLFKVDRLSLSLLHDKL